MNIKTFNAALLLAGTILNATICTIHSKHETLFIFKCFFLMLGSIVLKKFFQIKSKNLLDEMLLKSIVVDFCNYVFVLIVIFS